MYTRIKSATFAKPQQRMQHSGYPWDKPVKTRNAPYPRDKSIIRFPVPDDKIDWNAPYPEYTPVSYTHPKVLGGRAWTDPHMKKGDSHNIQFNTIDNNIDRTSLVVEKYKVVNGYPLNPMGRTGIEERGSLGRWGPNHAADSVVTRWKRDEKDRKVYHPDTNKPILQFVSILRRDTGQWAVPGGMVDPGEEASETVKREFSEEAMSSITASEEELANIKQSVNMCFQNGTTVYKGYSDDPRNTDNAWMETVAINFHDDTGESLGRFQLVAGDDASNVTWKDFDQKIECYASHRTFVETVAGLRNCHW